MTENCRNLYVTESRRFVFIVIFGGCFYFRSCKYLATCVADVSVQCVGVRWNVRIVLKLHWTKLGENLLKFHDCLRKQMKTPLAPDAGQSSTSLSGCFCPGKGTHDNTQAGWASQPVLTYRRRKKKLYWVWPESNPASCSSQSINYTRLICQWSQWGNMANLKGRFLKLSSVNEPIKELSWLGFVWNKARHKIITSCGDARLSCAPLRTNKTAFP